MVLRHPKLSASIAAEVRFLQRLADAGGRLPSPCIWHAHADAIAVIDGTADWTGRAMPRRSKRSAGRQSSDRPRYRTCLANQSGNHHDRQIADYMDRIFEVPSRAICRS
jgi:hypothetical protein